MHSSNKTVLCNRKLHAQSNALRKRKILEFLQFISMNGTYTILLRISVICVCDKEQSNHKRTVLNWFLCSRLEFFLWIAYSAVNNDIHLIHYSKNKP